MLGHGGRSPLTILETLGHGAGFFDYDGDDRLDIVLLGPNKIALYHNEGGGKFRDATEGSGLRQKGYWQGCATGDYDNDGRMDLYVSGYRTNALYHNESGGRFRDVTREAGVSSKLWGASASFVDVDHDGRLDLFVTNYVQFFPTSTQFCNFNGQRSTCGPTHYDPEKPRLYRNLGGGRFADETKQRGVLSANGNALGSAIADYNGDGWIDIAVANDQLPGDMLRNDGKGSFDNAGLESGTAYDAGGQAHAGMGIDWADFDADGSLEMLVTTYQHQPTSIYFRTAPGLYSDMAQTVGIGQATLNYVGFGARFLDYDNDGLPDVLIANGHAVDNIDKLDQSTSYFQPAQLFRNMGDRRAEEVTARAGPDFQRKIVGRGLATGDYDNDGRVDALIVDVEGRPLLLRNEAESGNRRLSLRLIGSKSNRDGIGAEITLEYGGRKLRKVVSTDGSFMSANDPRAHFGLGTAAKADRVTVRWPSGKRTVHKDLPAGAFLAIHEESGSIRPETPR